MPSLGVGIRFFGSVRFGSSVFEEIRFLENRNRSVPRNFRNRVFRFSVISVLGYFGSVSILTELTEFFYRKLR